MGKVFSDIPTSGILLMRFVTDEDKFDGISGAKALMLPSKLKVFQYLFKL
ncbi:MAG: hypothetical protein ACLRMX_01510 [Lachnospira eligens]